MPQKTKKDIFLLLGIILLIALVLLHINGFYSLSPPCLALPSAIYSGAYANNSNPNSGLIITDCSGTLNGTTYQSLNYSIEYQVAGNPSIYLSPQTEGPISIYITFYRNTNLISRLNSLNQQELTQAQSAYQSNKATLAYDQKNDYCGYQGASCMAFAAKAQADFELIQIINSTIAYNNAFLQKNANSTTSTIPIITTSSSTSTTSVATTISTSTSSTTVESTIMPTIQPPIPTPTPEIPLQSSPNWLQNLINQIEAFINSLGL